jgi:hypothetical protein
MTGDFSVSCPKDSYITEISGRADAVSLQGLRLSCSDGSLLFAFDTGIGRFVTNMHPAGYALIEFSTFVEGFASLFPHFYFTKWADTPQGQIGDLGRSGIYSEFSCVRNPRKEITGFSGHIDVNDKQYPIKSIKIYCACTFIT